jgi:probable phosphomutase (TIGR03848 family)
MTTLLLVRHGMTDAVGRVLSGWMPGVGLNVQGRAQVQALAPQLQRVSLAAVYSSPLERARQTADAIAAVHGLEVRLLDEVGEVRYGDWTGRRFTELEPDETWQRYNRMRSGTRIPGGELTIDIQARVVSALVRLSQAHPGERIVVVSHADVIKLAVGYVLGSPIDFMMRIEIEPASVTTLELQPYSARVLGVNVTGRH